MKLIITCEHGGNHIPEKYLSFFKNAENTLCSHQGYDLGALNIFQKLKPLSNYSKYSKTSRLLIELNRSLHHPNVFSKFTKQLSKTEKNTIIKTYYEPYRNNIESKIISYLNTNQRVVHISIHSFTPVLNKMERNCDIGLLFDTSKKEEKFFCKQFKSILKEQDSNFTIRYNYPYLGKADGFTSYLRKKFPENYLGIELEVNQKFSNHNTMNHNLKTVLYNTLKEVVYKHQ
ncbi:N-formylglutamate amidohydrolase [Pseudalgibacter alginicilyticus]|uniref:N-formylglutamate amidohydrolase n=1 Tax=Pseudalgibacter alginicilyticus TaxID=1736674 RepID=A0A0P0D2L8_9FLAO|nr:N-formylglutamate amidohydrolase [Pseudalgibacter alginicilyticus]ALJ04071.1 N-formylglutamate amidohydrolase [Pseudalgibacter alginicilyticus]